MYKKGDFLYFDFTRMTYNYGNSHFIKKRRPVVVLHSRETPYKTITIAAITEAESLEEANAIPNNYLKLDSTKYRLGLTKDCYINLDMIATVDGVDLEFFEAMGTTIQPHLDLDDIKLLDNRMALTFELKDFVQSEREAESIGTMKAFVNYIDIVVRKKVDTITSMIQDDEVKRLTMELLEDDLIGSLTNQIKHQESSSKAYQKPKSSKKSGKKKRKKK